VPSMLPILLLGGGAVLLMAAGKKKKRKAGPTGTRYTPAVPPPPPPLKTVRPPAQTTSEEIWRERQIALWYLAEVGVCPDCHPINMDGVYTPNTEKAVIAFQTYANIEPDGKWGPQTEGAMNRILEEMQKAAKERPPVSKKPEIKICNPRQRPPGATSMICTPDGEVIDLDSILPKNVKYNNEIISPAVILNPDLEPSRVKSKIAGIYLSCRDDAADVAGWNFTQALRTLSLSYPDIIFEVIIKIRKETSVSRSYMNLRLTKYFLNIYESDDFVEISDWVPSPAEYYDFVARAIEKEWG